MAAPRPACKCGYDRDHLMVSREPRYGVWKGFWVMFMGVSMLPYRVDFRCRVCLQVFDATTDPAVMKDTM